VTSDRTISILLMIGSACFAVGAVPAYAGAVGVTADGVTFFVGSLFFTEVASGSGNGPPSCVEPQACDPSGHHPCRVIHRPVASA
jgi:hypothetical protein